MNMSWMPRTDDVGIIDEDIHDILAYFQCIFVVGNIVPAPLRSEDM